MASQRRVRCGAVWADRAHWNGGDSRSRGRTGFIIDHRAVSARTTRTSNRSDTAITSCNRTVPSTTRADRTSLRAFHHRFSNGIYRATVAGAGSPVWAPDPAVVDYGSG